MILTPHDVVQPDLVVVTNPGQISARGIEGAPTLLIEVASRSTVTYDRSTRSRRYAALGVPHLWFLDPEGRSLQRSGLDGDAWIPVVEGAGDQAIEHPDWPGLVIRLADLWPASRPIARSAVERVRGSPRAPRPTRWATGADPAGCPSLPA